MARFVFRPFCSMTPVSEKAVFDATLAPPTKTRRRHGRFVLVLAVALLVACLMALPSPIGSPATLHLWSHDFNSADAVCEGDIFDCLVWAPPLAAAPMTTESVRSGLHGNDRLEWT